MPLADKIFLKVDNGHKKLSLNIIQGLAEVSIDNIVISSICLESKVSNVSSDLQGRFEKLDFLIIA